ncbi:MAG: HIT domain-containing protein [Nanoarchaeota archaeon]|nr:HIT domain-containing protein [Nanoarchaeota archaeon]
MMDKCIFCKIIAGEIPAHKIYESKHFIAMLDVNPVIAGHVIIVTKRHTKTIHTLNPEECKELGVAMHAVSKKLEKKFGSHLTMSNSSGEWASQSVNHFHIHMIPRTKNDRLWNEDQSRIVLDKSSGFERLNMTIEELEKMADELKV